ncbi:MAG: metallophosphoesterase [Verrucomicrobia bacterium]|nr:metallophosphoesterase [Verrucomicrobiota bacterium]
MAPIKILSILCILSAASPSDVLATTPVDLLAGGTRELSADKRAAGNTESPRKDVLVFKKAGKYSGEMRIQFTVEDPAQFTALALRKSSSIRPVSLNGKPIPLPLEGMSYKTIPGIPASLLAPGTNELLLAWTQTVKSSTPKVEEGAPPAKPVMRPAKLSVAKVDVQLLGQTPSALAFQTGPILGHAGETFFTVSCRTTLPAEVVLNCNGQTYISAPALIHTFKIEGLKPATAYSYSLQARLAPNGKFIASTPGYSTRTLPRREPFVFAALGDSRTRPKEWAKVGDAVAKAKPAFSVFVGDMVTAGRSDYQWDEQYFGPAKNYFATLPYYPIIGNHEQNAPLFLEIFQTPGGETTWSQTVGPVLLIGIDGSKDFSKGGAKTKWMEDLLAKSKAKYIFLFSHYPAWTSGGHGGLTEQGFPRERPIHEAQTILMPLLKKYNAAAMIAGHDHFYERSEPTNGVTMIISGGAGAPLRSKAKTAEQQNPHSKVFASQLHYCLFSVTAETCTMKVLTPEGEIIDTRQWPARAAE